MHYINNMISHYFTLLVVWRFFNNIFLACVLIFALSVECTFTFFCLDTKESNKEKIKAPRLLAKNHSDNLNCANLHQRWLSTQCFKHRTVLNGYLLNFLNAKIPDARINTKYTPRHSTLTCICLWLWFPLLFHPAVLGGKGTEGVGCSG